MLDIFTFFIQILRFGSLRLTIFGRHSTTVLRLNQKLIINRPLSGACDCCFCGCCCWQMPNTAIVAVIVLLHLQSLHLLSSRLASSDSCSVSQSDRQSFRQSFSQFVTCRGRWLSLQLLGDAMQTPGDKTPKFNATTANQLHSII